MRARLAAVSCDRHDAMLNIQTHWSGYCARHLVHPLSVAFLAYGSTIIAAMRIF